MQVEIDTRIRANLIQALEDGDLGQLPPEPFARGLIRSYAGYLKLDPQEMLDLYAADTIPTAAPPPVAPPVKRPSPVPHPPATRPLKRDETRDTSPPSPAPSPRSATPENATTTPIPSSVPEPFKSLRRRLPLAPPSPKPPKPILKTSKGNPLPPIPPETLPPPEYFAPMPVPVVKPSEESAREIPLTPVLDTAPLLPTANAAVSEKGSALEKTAPAIQMPGNLAKIPVPSVILFAIAVVFGTLACGLFGYTRVVPAALSIASAPKTSTPTRIARTATPTILPGATSTGVPIIAATAPPFETTIGNPTPAPATKPALTRTLDGTAALNLDIDATLPITVQVGIDGVLVFNGPIAPNASLSWSGRESLYLRVENLPGATVTFNGRKQLALNFGERSLFIRQWIVNSAGKIVAVTPTAPSSATRTPLPISAPPSPTAVTATPTAVPASPTSTPTITVSATPTLIPASPSAVPTSAPTDTATPSDTPTPSETPTPTETPTPSDTPTPTGPTPTLTPFS